MRSLGLRSSAWPTHLSVCCRSSNAGSGHRPISAARHARPRPKRPIPRGENGHDTLCVAIYARVSSEQQATSNTIDSQIAALEARLAQDGLCLTPDCCFIDEGYSGATLVRPALERLRDAVAA